jgi:hypothetical protein
MEVAVFEEIRGDPAERTVPDSCQWHRYTLTIKTPEAIEGGNLVLWPILPLRFVGKVVRSARLGRTREWPREREENWKSLVLRFTRADTFKMIKWLTR